MRISSRAHYAVRAILDLALHAERQPVSIQEIAKRQGISPAYLEQLFNKLRRGRVIRSVRGARGGYMLAQPAGEVTLARIMEVVGEPLDLVSCQNDQDACDREGHCMTQALWKRLGEHIRCFLDEFTVEQLLEEYSGEGVSQTRRRLNGGGKKEASGHEL